MTDADNIAQAQRQMQECAIKLGAMSGAVAEARQVKEYDSDRKKRALSVLVAEELRKGTSVGASEHLARASDAYGAQLIELGAQYKEAMRTIEEADAVRIKFESARSILSVEKQKLGLL